MNLYHYTSLEAATKIISKGCLEFHGSRYDCMNDPTDYVFARDEIIPKLKVSLQESKAQNAIVPFPYILSFCKSDDNFLMWRLYNAEVSLVLNSELLPFNEWNNWNNKQISDIVSYGDVKYSNDKSIGKDSIGLFNSAKNRTDNEIDDFYLNVIPFIKHEAYSMENEYRLVKVDYLSLTAKYKEDAKDKCEMQRHELTHDIKIRDIKNGDIRFYKKFKLPKESLVGIIIHTFDKEMFESIKKHLQLWLANNDYDLNNIKITQTISYPVRSTN